MNTIFILTSFVLLQLYHHHVVGFVQPPSSSIQLISHSSSKRGSSANTEQNDENTTAPSSSSSSSKKKRKKNETIQWIACTSTKEVNRAIEMYIQKGDVIAELGSQLRDTSKTICETIGDNGRAYLVDIERKYPNMKIKREKRMTAMRREEDSVDFYPDRARFCEIESFDSWRHALFFQKGRGDRKGHFDGDGDDRFAKYNALVVDMSTIAGNDLELTCVSLVKEFIALNKNIDTTEANDNQEGDKSTNPCRVVIIKSGSLHQLARKLFHAQRLFAGVASLDDNPHETSIIGTVGVDEYRRTIPYTVRKGDAVIEVGSHFGTSTAILHDVARKHSDEVDSCISDLSLGGCLGVDVGPHIIEAAKEKFPCVPFVVGDAWKISDLIQFKRDFFGAHSFDHRFDVVYVDVGGLSGNEGLLEALSLLGSITNCLEPRCIVIKSLCIRRLASSLVPFSKVWKQEKLRAKKNDELEKV